MVANAFIAGLLVAGPPIATGTALCAGLVPAHAAAIWRRGESMEPAAFDPHKATTLPEQRILDEIYEGLTIYNGDGKLQPGVATSWEISPDKLTYTFHLRGDARWSNGDRVTADDFVFAFRRLMSPATGAPYASILYAVKNARGVNTGGLAAETLGVSAPDPATFVIRLEHPADYLLGQLTHMTALPLHRREIERWGSGFARPGRMVGNGAFTLERYVPNDRIVLKKNPYFHDAAHVALDGEVFLPLEDSSAGLRRFLAGEIDSYPNVPVDEIDFVRRRLPAELHVAPQLATSFYSIDCTNAPFDDVRVRQALSMVVDRRFLSAIIWRHTMLPLFSFIPPGIPGYGAPATLAWKDNAPLLREDNARALLKAAGFGEEHPLRVTFRYNGTENNRATAIAVADMWKTLGVQTDFIVTDATTHYAFLASHRPFDLARGGWFADFADAQNFLFIGESSNKGLNYANFSDPAFDALMRAAEVEGDAARRDALLHRAEAIILAQQPYLVLMSVEATNLVSPHLQGWHANIMDHHPGRYIAIDR